MAGSWKHYVHSLSSCYTHKMQLRSDITNETERAAYLAQALDGLYDGPAQPSGTPGGRRAALERLAAFDVQQYDRQRNYVLRNGVSRLSAYLRHGVLTLAEVRADLLARTARTPALDKYLNELAWRAFWQVVYADHGRRIRRDLRPARYRSRFARRGQPVPADVAAAQTGLHCIDASLRELYTEGTMHNHARMWVAAYLLHWRGLEHQVGARLFYRFLLDGDPASNGLSWQWVAGTFSRKPYFFNRRNVEQYSDGRYCRSCARAATGDCPFDASYEQLSRDLFGVELSELNGEPPTRPGRR